MKFLLTVLGATLLSAGCATTTAPVEPRDQFMATLKSLCGQRYEGGLKYAIDPKSDFAGKVLATEVVCTDTGVRMPVRVGEDRSRTWVITRSPAGLELRHDHRHADGTPDAVTMYGGLAWDGGTALSQSFVADGHTARLVAGSETNVWTISFSPDKRTLTYYLERHGKPRVQFVFQALAG